MTQSDDQTAKLVRLPRNIAEGANADRRAEQRILDDENVVGLQVRSKFDSRPAPPLQRKRGTMMENDFQEQEADESLQRYYTSDHGEQNLEANRNAISFNEDGSIGMRPATQDDEIHNLVDEYPQSQSEQVF